MTNSSDAKKLIKLLGLEEWVTPTEEKKVLAFLDARDSKPPMSLSAQLARQVAKGEAKWDDAVSKYESMGLRVINAEAEMKGEGC